MIGKINDEPSEMIKDDQFLFLRALKSSLPVRRRLAVPDVVVFVVSSFVVGRSRRRRRRRRLCAGREDVFKRSQRSFHRLRRRHRTNAARRFGRHRRVAVFGRPESRRRPAAGFRLFLLFFTRCELLLRRGVARPVRRSVHHPPAARRFPPAFLRLVHGFSGRGGR